MRSSTNFRIQQGYDTETIVASLLPGSIHLNSEEESRQPYDIIWNGIQIDVKSSKGNQFNQSRGNPKSTDDIILVYICIGGDVNYFWVRHLAGQGAMVYGNEKTCLTADQLQDAIITCHKVYSSVYNKTVDNKHIV